MGGEDQTGGAKPQSDAQGQKKGEQGEGRSQQRRTAGPGAPGERGTERSSGGLSRRERLEPELFGAWRGSPFSLMRRMMEDLDRMFEEAGAGRWLETPWSGEGRRGVTREALWMPQVDVLEREGRLVVRADLPGVARKDLRVEVTDDALVLEGERRREVEEERGGMSRSERSYGSFHRAIPLPEGVDPEKVEARFDGGVLEVTLPLAPEASRRKRIEVQEGPSGKSVH